MQGLIENIWWKLFSLLVAIVLWYLIVGDTEVAVSMPVVVQYRNIPADMEITGDHLDRLFLKVHGPRPRVTAEALSRTALMFDLSKVHTPGEQTITITGAELGLPSGVQLLRVVPAQIRVRVEKRAMKSVPVQARITGAPPKGYRITEQRISPEYVSVVGPQSHLSLLSTALTDPVSLDSTVGNVEFRVPVALDDPQLRLAEPQLISVGITLEKTP